VAREGGPHEKRLVGYVVTQPEVSVSSSELRAHLHDATEYMVPSVLMFLPQLPLSSSGKVDRKALPDPELSEQQQYVAPRTPDEEVLAQIWVDVLHVPRVGIHDNFFDLGGDSLALVRTLAR